MKKFFCIFLISCLFVSSLVVSSFAEETVTVTVHNLTNTTKTFGYRLNGSSDSYVQQSILPNDSASFTFSLDTVYEYANYGSGFLSTNSSTLSPSDPGTVSSDSLNPTVLSSTITDLYIGQYISSGLFYFTFVAPADPIGDGVGSQVGFVGQILDFITGNSFIVALVGLSIGMCFVVPFGIRKLKGLIKGY